MSTLVARNDLFQVKEEDYDKVIAHFNMTDKTVRESIESIHQWYKMQLHLPEGALSDDRLFRLLLATGFSLEKLKQKIDNLLTARNTIPEFLVDRDLESERIQAVRKYTQVAFLPQRLDDMSRVFIYRFKGEDLTNYNVCDAMKMAFMAYDFRLCLDVCTGDHFITDFKDIKLGHVTQMTPTVIKKTLFVLQGCFGSKIKGMHYVNVPHYAELIVALFKTGLSKKLASRLHTHKTYEGLYKFFPKSILPSDMGGENKSTEELADILNAQLSTPQWRAWFLQQDQYKSDESKRVGAASDMSRELLGTQGSFRTLNID